MTRSPSSPSLLSRTLRAWITVIAILTFTVTLLGVVFASPVRAAANATLSGQVLTNADLGFPVQSVSVTLYRAGYPSPVATMTAANGTYSFAQLEPGEYEVKMSGPVVLTQWQGGTADRATAERITVAAPDGTDPQPTSFDLTARVRPVITIYAKRPNGASLPVPAQVGVSAQTGDTWTPLTGVTVSSGWPSTARPDYEGPVRVFVRDSTVPGSFRYYYGNAYSAQRATDVTAVSGGSVDLGMLTYPATATWVSQIRNANDGVLYGNLSAWANPNGTPERVEYGPTGADGTSFATTAAQPTLSLTVPADTPVTLHAKGADPADGFVPGFYGGNVSAEEATYETLAAGTTLTGAFVHLAGGRSLLFRVYDRAVVAVPNVTIELRNQVGALVSSGVSDSSGYFYMHHLPGNTGATPTGQPYTVKVVGEGNFYKGFRAKTGGWTDDPSNTFYGYSIPKYGPVLESVRIDYPPEFNIEPTSEPSLSGDPVLGAKVTLTPPTWNMTPAQVTYQWWLRDYQSTGVVDRNIYGGPTSMLSYQSTTSDPVNSRFAIRIVASKPGYGSWTTDFLPSLYLQAFTEVTPAVLSGTPVVGNTLVLTPPTHNFWHEHVDISYAWMRQSSSGSWSPVTTSTGAALAPTTTAYRLTTADIGKRIVITPTAVTNDLIGFSTNYTSIANTPVTTTVVKARSGITQSLTTKTTKVRKRVWRNGRWVYVYVTVRTLRIAVKVTTPGVLKPGGRLNVSTGGRVVLSVVPSSGVVYTKTLPIPSPQKKTVVARYGGSAIAIPASKTSSIYVR